MSRMLSPLSYGPAGTRPLNFEDYINWLRALR